MSIREYEEERQQREQFLKSEINRLVSKHGELNTFLQERTTEGWGEHVIDVAMQHIQKLESENQRLRKALEEIENSSAGDFDYIRQIAEQALEGDSK